MIATQYAITKEVKSNPKLPSCKKVCCLKKAIVEKDVKSSRNSCDSRLMAKFLIMAIQVNLMPNPSETCRRQHKFT